jgi:hypothetical protein
MSGDDALETVCGLVRQMEALLLGLQQLRGYVGSGVGKAMLDVLIQEAEVGLEEVKQNLIPTKSARNHHRIDPAVLQKFLFATHIGSRFATQRTRSGKDARSYSTTNFRSIRIFVCGILAWRGKGSDRFNVLDAPSAEPMELRLEVAQCHASVVRCWLDPQSRSHLCSQVAESLFPKSHWRHRPAL